MPFVRRGRLTFLAKTLRMRSAGTRELHSGHLILSPIVKHALPRGKTITGS